MSFISDENSKVFKYTILYMMMVMSKNINEVSKAHNEEAALIHFNLFKSLGDNIVTHYEERNLNAMLSAIGGFNSEYSAFGGSYTFAYSLKDDFLGFTALGRYDFRHPSTEDFFKMTFIEKGKEKGRQIKPYSTIIFTNPKTVRDMYEQALLPTVKKTFYDVCWI